MTPVRQPVGLKGRERRWERLGALSLLALAGVGGIVIYLAAARLDRDCHTRGDALESLHRARIAVGEGREVTDADLVSVREARLFGRMQPVVRRGEFGFVLGLESGGR